MRQGDVATMPMQDFQAVKPQEVALAYGALLERMTSRRPAFLGAEEAESVCSGSIGGRDPARARSVAVRTLALMGAVLTDAYLHMRSGEVQAMSLMCELAARLPLGTTTKDGRAVPCFDNDELRELVYAAG
jgi:hypothetical protein